MVPVPSAAYPPLPGGLKPELLDKYIMALFEQGWSNLRIEKSVTGGGTAGYTAHGELTTAQGEQVRGHMFGRTPAEAFYSLGRHVGRHFSATPVGTDTGAAVRAIKVLQEQLGTALAVVALYAKFMKELRENGNESVQQLVDALDELILELHRARGGAERAPDGMTVIRPVTDRNHPATPMLPPGTES
jgi:hypothetical protein